MARKQQWPRLNDPQLALELPQLSRPNAKLAGEYFQRAEDFERRQSELAKALAQLSDEADKLRLSELEQRCSRIRAGRLECEEEYKTLLWARWELLQLLAHDFQLAVDAAERNQQLGIQAARQRFAREKIGESAFPGVTEESRRQQFEHHLKTQPEVLRTNQPLREARDRVRWLAAARHAYPRETTATMAWPQPAGPYAGIVLQMLDRGPQGGQQRHDMLETVVRELGLQDAALLADHHAVLQAICEMVEKRRGWARPIQLTAQGGDQKLEKMLRRLPQTESVEQLLDNIEAKAQPTR